MRNRVMVWFGRGSDDDGEYDPVAHAPDPIGRTPDEELQSHEAMLTLEEGIAALPGRQREAFMLRTFEGLDVAGTAVAMGCSEGSVKTHYSRAQTTPSRDCAQLDACASRAPRFAGRDDQACEKIRRP